MEALPNSVSANDNFYPKIDEYFMVNYYNLTGT